MNLMDQSELETPAFSSLGGRLCLDFVNTLAHRMKPIPDESLFEYRDLVSWGLSLGGVSAQQAETLLRKAAISSQEAELAYQLAVTLREASFRVFSRLSAGNEPMPSDLSLVQDHYASATSHQRLQFGETGWLWTMPEEEPPLSLISLVVARSVIDVLVSGEYKRVKQCPGLNDCGYLFYDASKNGTRRWCSMDFCGSRAKMRALYARRNQNTPPPESSDSQTSFSKTTR